MKDLGYAMGSTSFLTLSMAQGHATRCRCQISAAIEKASSDEKMRQAALTRNMDPYVPRLGPATVKLIEAEEKAFAEMLKSRD